MMRAGWLVGVALLAGSMAAAQEPTFLDSHGKVIGQKPDESKARRKDRAEKADDKDAGTAGDKPRGKMRGGQCIPLKAIKTETAETSGSLIFHTKDGRAYRNRLPAPCDGLLDVNNLGELGLKGKDGKLCAGDGVWLKQSGVRAALGVEGDAGPETCKLGRFEAISEMSLSEFLRR